MRIQRILAPTDLSQASENALAHAAQLAQILEAELHLVHIHTLDESTSLFADVLAQQPDLQEAIEARVNDLLELARARMDAAPRRVVKDQVKALAAGPGLVDYIERNAIDLVVMATHNRKGLSRFLVGSVTQDVLRHGGVNAITVPHEAPGVDGRGHVLVAVDLSEDSLVALREAAAISDATGARIEMLHVIPPRMPVIHYEAYAGYAGPEPEVLEAEARKRMKQLVERAELSPAADVEITVLQGTAANRILDRARQTQTDALVLTVRRSTRVERWLLGSVAEQVVAASSRPVLVVHVDDEGGAAAFAPTPGLDAVNVAPIQS